MVLFFGVPLAVGSFCNGLLNTEHKRAPGTAKNRWSLAIIFRRTSFCQPYTTVSAVRCRFSLTEPKVRQLDVLGQV